MDYFIALGTVHIPQQNTKYQSMVQITQQNHDTTITISMQVN